VAGVSGRAPGRLQLHALLRVAQQWRGQLGATTYGSIASILRHGLDKSLFAKLAAGNWITRHKNLIIIGKTGLGNSSSKVAWCGGCRRLAARRLQ
jgi:hypothetical protein